MSIISISGKIGSGKDTVGRIIQYLTSTRTYEKSFIEWEEITKTTERHYAGYSSFKIHKWADALKQFIADSTGCTREQLEDRDFKNKELGEEWWYFKGYVPNVLNTKETIELVQKFNTEQEAWIYIENELNYNKDICKVETIKPTPRLLLQLIGTDAIRKHVHPNYWVNCLMSKYKSVNTNIKTSNIYNDKRLSHGYNKTRIFRIYHNIKQRCNNPKHPRYKSYGGNNIKLCKEWEDSLESFIEWSEANGYKETLTLDRKDNTKGYYPDNCRWTSYGTQATNQGIRKDNTSGFKGVTKEKGKWRADTQINKKRMFLGYFSTAEEASEAYEQAFLEKEKLYDKEDKARIVYPNWVISDTRFPNELKAVKDRGGVTIRINRTYSKIPIYIPGEECNGISRQDFENARPKHESETALDNAEFDYTIENEGSIIELIGKVREILIKENFIK